MQLMRTCGLLILLCTAASAQTPQPTQQQMPSPPRPALATYQNVADAKAHCGNDAVVWANSASHVTHTDHSRYYGKTKQGFYVCQSQATNAGYRAAKN